MSAESFEFRVKKTVFPATGERFVIVEGPPRGIAIDATSIYTSRRLREMGLSPNSMAQHLAAIVLLLKWAASQVPVIDLDQRLQSVQLFISQYPQAPKSLKNAPGACRNPVLFL